VLSSPRKKKLCIFVHTEYPLYSKKPFRRKVLRRGEKTIPTIAPLSKGRFLSNRSFPVRAHALFPLRVRSGRGKGLLSINKANLQGNQPPLTRTRKEGSSYSSPEEAEARKKKKGDPSRDFLIPTSCGEGGKGRENNLFYSVEGEKKGS